MSVTGTLLNKYADRREEIHSDHATSRPLSDGYEKVGISGELAFGIFSGLMPDLPERPGGDKGIDFTINLRFTVDVKTARKAMNLIHERGKPVADIMVLAEYDDETQEARLVGWAWGNELLRAPVRDFGYGVINHYIHRDNLKPMSKLSSRMAAL